MNIEKNKHNCSWKDIFWISETTRTLLLMLLLLHQHRITLFESIQTIDGTGLLVNNNQLRMAYSTSMEVSDVDYSYYRRKLWWIALDRIKNTFETTTQLAKNYLRLPLRKHFKSRYQKLNWNRLQEKYATDNIFSSTKRLHDQTCAQIFVGKKSQYTKVYVMTNES